MIFINASLGEGGGQVLRTALALSAITGQAAQLHSIRAKRKNPGLAPQHLLVVQALAKITKAEVKGAALRSQTLTFAPQTRPQPGEYVFDVTEAAKGGSAGAVTLLWQAVWLPLALAGSASRLTLRGGTHVPWSPSFHYLQHTFIPMMARAGFDLRLRLNAWGFYPVGGGEVVAEIKPATVLRPLDLRERGAARRVQGLAVAVNLPAHIAQRLAARATNRFAIAALPATITPSREKSAVGMGAGLWLWVEHENARAGFGALGERGKPSEHVADEAVDALIAHDRVGVAVDPYLADQLLLPLALVPAPSVYATSALTPHTLTNAEVIQYFLPTLIRIEGGEGEPGMVRVGE
jgi:RNA 3'-terminal phosphate cyclase (ATP)